MFWQSFWQNSPRFRMFATIMSLVGTVVTPLIIVESLGLKCNNTPETKLVITEHMDHGRWAKAKEMLLAIKSTGLDRDERKRLLSLYKKSTKDAKRFAQDFFKYRWWISYPKDNYKLRTPYIYVYNTKAARFSRKQYRLKSDWLVEKKTDQGFKSEIIFLKRLGKARYRIYRYFKNGERTLAELRLKN